MESCFIKCFCLLASVASGCTFFLSLWSVHIFYFVFNNQNCWSMFTLVASLDTISINYSCVKGTYQNYKTILLITHIAIHFLGILIYIYNEIISVIGINNNSRPSRRAKAPSKYKSLATGRFVALVQPCGTSFLLTLNFC